MIADSGFILLPSVIRRVSPALSLPVAAICVTLPVMTTTKDTKMSVPVCNFWEQLSWSDIAEHFGNPTTQRGRDYAKHGHVESIWTTEDGKNILAVVRGSNEYHTLVTLSENGKKKQFEFHSECSCPVGYDCKHAVAAIAKYLDLLANNKPIAGCAKRDDKTWEVFSPNGTKDIITIDEYDEDDWNESQPVSLSVRKSKAGKDGLKTALKEKLQAKSAKELSDLIILLFQQYGEVQEHFERETFAESVAATGDIAQLVDKAVKFIDKAFADNSHSRHSRYGESLPDLGPVLTVVKQFATFDDPLPAIDRVARHAIKKAIHFVEGSHVEDTSEIDDIFCTMVDMLLQSKTSPVTLILWAHEISNISDYGLAESGTYRILDHSWSAKVWSDVADEMINTDPAKYRLRTIVKTLDKANRQKEATNLLRKEAPKTNEFRMLVDRLIEFNLLDEAEKIVFERRQAEAKTAKERYGHYHDHWITLLKTIAERREDWLTLASIQAAEFFQQPYYTALKQLLFTVKKIEGIEPEVRTAIQKFLQSGKYPAAVKKASNNENPTPHEQKQWAIPFFVFPLDTKWSGPFFDILCEWAVNERRPDDVVKWYDEYVKNKTPQRRGIDHEKVADAIAESHPDRAFQIYRNTAEYEIEVTRQYVRAVKILRKARKALEQSGRGEDWSKVMEEIRTTHRRKKNLMMELNNLETPSIVQQKRKG